MISKIAKIKPSPSNWELPDASVATMVKYLVYALGTLNGNLSITGYGDYQPIAGNDTDAGRAHNHHILTVMF